MASDLADKHDELFRNVPKDLFGSAANTNLQDGKVVVDERGYKFVIHTCHAAPGQMFVFLLLCCDYPLSIIMFHREWSWPLRVMTCKHAHFWVGTKPSVGRNCGTKVH